MRASTAARKPWTATSCRKPRLPAEELAPCGGPGLGWVKAFPAEPASWPDLADCLVVRPLPFRLVIWEPLRTKAPSPPKTSAYCCYLRTVIFYLSPYVVRPWRNLWRTGKGQLQASRGGFEEWDKIETRLGWDDVVRFEGEDFVVVGGTVVWARRRWWMRHGARRVDPRP